MATGIRQKLKIINGLTEVELKNNIESWLNNTVPIPVVNCMTIDIPNTRAAFIYSEQVEEII